MLRLSALFALLASLSMLFVAPAVAETTPASLQGEEFHAVTFNQLTISCNASGNSTFQFSVSGIATGPYPGPFTENGIIVVGPQTQAGGPGGDFGMNAGPVILAHADFTVDSVLGQVVGSKDLAEAVPQQPFSNTGVCATLTGESTVGEQLCREVTQGTAGFHSITIDEAYASARYQATITTPAGAFSDMGLAPFVVSNTERVCETAANELITAGGTFFTEDFILSEGVVPLITTGHATGGGQIDQTPPGKGDGVAFGFTVFSRDREIQASCNVVDADVHIKCLDATAYFQSGNHAHFSGNATINGTPTTYQIDVQDNGEPGAGSDTFSIVTGDGYTADGVLTQGNIQVHG